MKSKTIFLVKCNLMILVDETYYLIKCITIINLIKAITTHCLISCEGLYQRIMLHFTYSLPTPLPLVNNNILLFIVKNISLVYCYNLS